VKILPRRRRQAKPPTYIAKGLREHGHCRRPCRQRPRRALSSRPGERYDVMIVDRMLPSHGRAVAGQGGARPPTCAPPVLFLTHGMGGIDDRVTGPRGGRRRLSGKALRPSPELLARVGAPGAPARRSWRATSAFPPATSRWTFWARTVTPRRQAHRAFSPGIQDPGIPAAPRRRKW